MLCVFGAFVLGDLRILKVFGFAMAVAILLDATLVRMAIPLSRERKIAAHLRPLQALGLSVTIEEAA